ncbi:hypothetical protein WICMUC_005489 [Wickerhamomyces mucosus]|uniref:AMP-activated protein kinase glycogen-binding domain-containing protein n=1 Tax=Wickerhamomyces mucosus TaxID=1378264 RepID=A0A9P8P8B3_9ASCO|nr:hypothetical protein WICMUC_005489 [Wickerhamomyces mucosus]
MSDNKNIVTISYNQSINSKDNDNIKIAGNFTNWKEKLLEFNSNTLKYEYKVNLLDFSNDNNQLKGKLNFKFIKNGNIWFIDENYASEFDSNGNENNVIIYNLIDDYNNDELLEFIDEPKTPHPTPANNLTISNYNNNNLTHEQDQIKITSNSISNSKVGLKDYNDNDLELTQDSIPITTIKSAPTSSKVLQDPQYSNSDNETNHNLISDNNDENGVDLINDNITKINPTDGSEDQEIVFGNDYFLGFFAAIIHVIAQFFKDIFST